MPAAVREILPISRAKVPDVSKAGMSADGFADFRTTEGAPALVLEVLEVVGA